MIDLRSELERRASAVVPRPDALFMIRARVRSRARSRRLLGAGTGATAALVAAVLIGHPLVQPMAPPSREAAPAGAPAPARELRTQMGITGSTKGVPSGVVVRTSTIGGDHVVLVQSDTGAQTQLPDGVSNTTVAPGSDGPVAGASGTDIVIVSDGAHGPTSHVVGSGDAGSLSWAPRGSALFARIDGRWRLVPAGSERPSDVRTLLVSKVAGGPTFLSVSPGGDLVLLFGVTWAGADGAAAAAVGRPSRSPNLSRSAPAPHLYLGDFDGTRVTDLHPVQVPATAVEGPLGWVGDNAFLITPGPGHAAIVRVDGTRIPVTPDAGADACRKAPPTVTCSSQRPQVLGTNEDGSLLYWRAVASWTEGAGQARSAVAYFSTWLDGTNPVLLAGDAGRFGPALAAR